VSNQKYTNLPWESFTGDPLAQLALNLRCSWNHASDEVWRRLDPELWNLTRNPWLILQGVSQETLDRLANDPSFQQLLAGLTGPETGEPRWFEKAHPNSPLKTVAYFCMEYMLSEALPIYSGGLGNVAGDQLKSADDLGVPVVAIGLLYQRGYFRQSLDSGGGQIALYPYNDPSQLPVTPLRDAQGEWVRLSLALPGFTTWIRVWQAQVGRAKLYLLDTNDPANLPEHRGITGELYGGGPEVRLRQELVLGIGGWRLMQAIGIVPAVCHLNEGHAAFAVLERARDYMDQTGQPFSTALSVTRAGNVFTTHTPVEAGFDRFPADLIRSHFGAYAETKLHIPIDQLLALGRSDQHNGAEPFNMAYLATRGSGAVNGVSRLHGEVSRRILSPLFPRWPVSEVPIQHVTNGVHTSTWDSAEADGLWTEACGKGFWRGDLQEVSDRVQVASDATLWRLRTEAKKILIEYVRERYARQVAAQGGSAHDIEAAGYVLNPGALTLGFARRFATYKRPTLLLHNPDRFLRILSEAHRPVQLIVAGKAHPQDQAGQDMIRQWNQFIRHHGLSNVVFLSDYDMLMTEQLVGGVDVWLNTPRRPWEASGTSGMKVLVNGGLNVSELDGWWAEAYAPEVGWAVGDGHEHGDDPAWDAADADSLYNILEREVVPQFYERDSSGVPVRWIARIRESMSRLTPAFSANRTVREYTENHYLKGAAAYASRAAEGGKLGKEIALWQEKLAASWARVHFGELQIQRRDDGVYFQVGVYLGDLDSAMVRVEMFADGRNGEPPFVKEMTAAHQMDGWGLFSTSVPATQDAAEYTPRIIPHHPAALVPLEANQILWQK
jgi:starch phosphorylase